MDDEIEGQIAMKKYWFFYCESKKANFSFLVHATSADAAFMEAIQKKEKDPDGPYVIKSMNRV